MISVVALLILNIIPVKSEGVQKTSVADLPVRSIQQDVRAIINKIKNSQMS